MESTWNDGCDRAPLSAAFLAEASFPVTIDPNLVTFGLRRGPPCSELKADVAYDLSSDLFVWSTRRSTARRTTTSS